MIKAVIGAVNADPIGVCSRIRRTVVDDRTLSHPTIGGLPGTGPETDRLIEALVPPIREEEALDDIPITANSEIGIPGENNFPLAFRLQDDRCVFCPDRIKADLRVRIGPRINDVGIPGNASGRSSSS